MAKQIQQFQGWVYKVGEDFDHHLFIASARVLKRTQKILKISTAEGVEYHNDSAFGFRRQLNVDLDEFYNTPEEAVKGFIEKEQLRIEKLQEEIEQRHIRTQQIQVVLCVYNSGGTPCPS